MKVVNVGVVGIGHLGKYHLEKYSKIPGCRIVGVADIVPQRAAEAAERYGCLATTDFRSLIGMVDAVSVAVPTVSHHEVARAFLAAGVDVLLEKPIAATLAEADELCTLAAGGGRILQIGFVERFNPAVMALNKVLKRPLFIESHRLHPFFERGTDVDVVLDLMIHDLDIILHANPSGVRTVEAVGIPVLSDKIDIANVRLTFEDGCVANLTASRVTGKTMQKIRFFGPDGYHAVDTMKRELVSLKRVRGEDGRWTIRDNRPDVADLDPLEEEIRSFIGCVKTRSAPVVSGREGRDALALALRILEEMKTGAPFETT